MKIKNIIQVSVLAGVMSLCYACSGSEDGLNEVAQEIQASRGTDVEATAALETAGTLETILKEAHGDDVANITKLTITGSFNGADRNFLASTLTNLHTLDMKGATIVADSENGYEAGWGTYYLKDNTVTLGMFTGFLALKTLVLPDNLLAIEREGFSQFPIESIEVPASVTSLGAYAFYSCESLKSVKLNEGLTSISDYCFYNCTQLVEIEIPASVTSLGRYAFSNCEKLAEVKLKANVTSIPEYCFDRCYALSKIELPATVEKLEYEAFSECSLTDFTPFENVTSFGTRAFDYCDFTEVKLSDKVTEMSTEVFAHCESLTSVEFLCNLSSVPNSTFSGCSNLSSVTLASSIVSVGNYSFSECGLLTDYAPFTNLTNIGSYAFHQCGFTDLNIPEGVTKLENAAFSNLPIQTLTLPSTLTEISDNVFNACHNLTTITVPTSVTTVGGSFFDNCTGLTSVFWNAAVDVPGISTNYKDRDISPNVLLYVTNENIKVDGSWKNLIINGVAQNLTLVAERPFHCPQEFTAKKISYTRNFNLSTSIGGNEGWETIVLPFVPTAYTHKDKGVIAPFDSETDTKKHFWLRGLTADGFADVTAMEVNKPYIISMPNSSDYAADYNLNGEVTFSAENVTVAVTPEPLSEAAGPGFALQPVYRQKATSISVYTLNVSNWLDSYGKGSVFAHSLERAVQPFEAYAFLTDGKAARRTRVINVGKNTSDSRAVTPKNTTGIPQKEDMN